MDDKKYRGNSLEWIDNQLEIRAEFQPEENRYVVDLNDVKALFGIGRCKGIPHLKVEALK